MREQQQQELSLVLEIEGYKKVRPALPCPAPPCPWAPLCLQPTGFPAHSRSSGYRSATHCMGGPVLPPAPAHPPATRTDLTPPSHPT